MGNPVHKDPQRGGRHADALDRQAEVAGYLRRDAEDERHDRVGDGPPPSELAPAMNEPNTMVSVMNQLSAKSAHCWLICIKAAHPTNVSPTAPTNHRRRSADERGGVELQNRGNA